MNDAASIGLALALVGSAIWIGRSVVRELRGGIALLRGEAAGIEEASSCGADEAEAPAEPRHRRTAGPSLRNLYIDTYGPAPTGENMNRR